MSQPAGNGRADPLFDTLFRSTVAVPDLDSAAPVRPAGTRARAGNAMSRTRCALLDGARRSVEATGTKISMSQVAVSAGVAKATLYNHFRTREAVLGALLEDEVTRIVTRTAGEPLHRALSVAATALSDNELLRALSQVEPATVAALGRIELGSPCWREARAAVAAALGASGLGGGDTVLRWLASFILTPADADAIEADLEIMLAGLAAACPVTEARSA